LIIRGEENEGKEEEEKWGQLDKLQPAIRKIKNFKGNNWEVVVWGKDTDARGKGRARYTPPRKSVDVEREGTGREFNNLGFGGPKCEKRKANKRLGAGGGRSAERWEK